MNGETEATPSGHSNADTAIELALGHVLRFGVILAVLITVAGAALLLIRNGHASGRRLLAAEAGQRSPMQIFSQAAHGDGSAIILIGLLVLLATPVFRVASMIMAFARERDWIYAAVSAAVLCVLIFGIVFAR
jgi:uncharacterized membrane protein